MSSAGECPPLTDAELETLRQVGRTWASALTVRRAFLRALPTDPGLARFGRMPPPTGLGRFAEVAMFTAEAPEELVVTEQAGVPQTRFGRRLVQARRLLLGPPLHSAAVVHERVRKLTALPVLASDLLSSVAYGPEAMLSVLVLAGSGALGLSLPIAGALLVLMIAVGLSYRQTIPAYPSGAGSYLVAGDNLGPLPGLAAAAGLLTDYVLTVAVSIASGIAAITSAVPGLAPDAVPIGLGMIALLLAGNLRGIRQAGNLFAAPTYAFVLAIFLLVGVGLAQAAGGGFSPRPAPPVKATEALGLLLVLRAFASGATSMTGIEAVSNAVTAFRPVEWRNARTTLTWMVSLLVAMFVGLIVLIHLDGIAPTTGQTVLSQLAHRAFGDGWLYGYVQVSTALILLFAANTAFNDFPRLLFYLARDRYASRIFLRLGDRLAFSNGIIALAVTAAVIYAVFRGNTEALVPLYAVGVFLAFTLSQTGMVVHWWRRRGAHWRRNLVVNGTGAVLSALVGLTAGVTKFTEGAWVVVISVPLLMTVCLRIRRHFDAVQQATALRSPPTGHAVTPAAHPPEAAHPVLPEGREREESPQQIRHLTVVPIARLDLAGLRALAYATSLNQPTFALHISPDEEEAARFRYQWNQWGDHLWLQTLISPYRSIVAPLARYLQALHAQQPDLTITVVLPDLVVRHRWHQLLHSLIAPRLRRALRRLPGIIITTVPFHL